MGDSGCCTFLAEGLSVGLLAAGLFPGGLGVLAWAARRDLARALAWAAITGSRAWGAAESSD